MIEIFSKMGITSSGFDFENTLLLDGEKEDIKSSSTEIEDQDIAFANNFLVETIGNSSESLMIWRMFIPEMVSASFVVCLC